MNFFSTKKPIFKIWVFQAVCKHSFSFAYGMGHTYQQEEEERVLSRKEFGMAQMSTGWKACTQWKKNSRDLILVVKTNAFWVWSNRTIMHDENFRLKKWVSLMGHKQNSRTDIIQSVHIVPMYYISSNPIFNQSITMDKKQLRCIPT